MAIVLSDIVVDGSDEFIDTLKDTAPDALLGDSGKPALDLIEPGAAGSRSKATPEESKPEYHRAIRGIFVRAGK